VTPLEAPEDERALLLAVQKPQVVENADTNATISFKTGPNLYPYEYDTKCYSVANTTVKPLTCSEISSTAATAVGDVVVGNLPLKYSRVSVNVTGFDDPIVDCYVTVSGPTGKNSKCSYAGRAELPLFYLAANGVTIKCPLAAVNSTGIVDGVEYTKRDREGLNTLENDSNLWGDLVTTCTTGVSDLSRLFIVRTHLLITFHARLFTEEHPKYSLDLFSTSGVWIQP